RNQDHLFLGRRHGQKRTAAMAPGTFPLVRRFLAGRPHAGGDVRVAPQVLATANGSGGVRLWDMDTGKELRRFEGERRLPDALIFSADGAMLAGADRGLVRLWETASGKEVSSAGNGHRRLAASVNFTPDGATLVSSGWDGSVRVWDTATGE